MERLLDRSSYSSRTLSTFEIISSYFVDFYYNGLYNEAVKFKESGKVENITQGYRHTVYRFMQTINSKSAGYNPKFYARMLRGINEWFIIHTSFSTLTLSDCIDKMTCEFIPEDFQDSVDKDQRRSILREIMNKVLNEFSRSVIHDYLVNIIDQHSDEDNVDLLKDKFIDLLLLQREVMYQRFMDTNAGKPKEVVDKSLLIRMRQELEKQIKEKIEFRERARVAEEALKNNSEEQLKIDLKNANMRLEQIKEQLTVRDAQIMNYRHQIQSLEQRGGISMQHNSYDSENNYIIPNPRSAAQTPRDIPKTPRDTPKTPRNIIKTPRETNKTPRAQMNIIDEESVNREETPKYSRKPVLPQRTNPDRQPTGYTPSNAYINSFRSRTPKNIEETPPENNDESDRAAPISSRSSKIRQHKKYIEEAKEDKEDKEHAEDHIEETTEEHTEENAEDNTNETPDEEPANESPSDIKVDMGDPLSLEDMY